MAMNPATKASGSGDILENLGATGLDAATNFEERPPNFNLELIKTFECQKCRQYVMAPIPQCRRGHLLCITCFRILVNCPICNDNLVLGMRNSAMENVSKLILFPCRFSTYGCETFLTGPEMRIHQDRCQHQLVECYSFAPLADCKWKGKYSDLISHLTSPHPKHIRLMYGNPIELQMFNDQIKLILKHPLIQMHNRKTFVHMIVAETLHSSEVVLRYVIWWLDLYHPTSRYKGKLQLKGQKGTLISDCLAWNPFCSLDSIVKNSPLIKSKYVDMITSGSKYTLQFTVLECGTMSVENWLMAQRGCSCDYECNLQNCCVKKLESGTTKFSSHVLNFPLK